MLATELRMMSFSPYWLGSRPGDLGPRKFWGIFGTGMKDSMLRRSFELSSPFIDGNMERFDSREGRVGTSGSKKLKLNVGDFWDGGSGVDVAAGLIIIEAASDVIVPPKESVFFGVRNTSFACPESCGKK